MQQKNFSLLIGAGLSLCLLVFLGAVIYARTELKSSGSVKDVNQRVEYIQNPSAELDPYIVHVPEEYFEQNKKSGKIFVSTVDPWTGNLGGRITLIAFLSFDDEASKELFNILLSLRDKYNEEVVVFWKDYYLSDEAKTKAVQAHCAGEQDKFWEYAQALMHQDLQDYQDLDEESFEECLDSGEMESVVNSGYFYGRSLEIKNAPVLYIDGEQFKEEITSENLDNFINQQINALQN